VVWNSFASLIAREVSESVDVFVCSLGHCIVMPNGMGRVSIVCIWQRDLD